MTIRIAPALCALAVFAAGGLSATAAQAQSFQVTGVTATGCGNANFSLAVVRAGLDGSNYTVRTQVKTDAGVFYMNEEATIINNGPSGWTLFNDFSYGPVPSQGAYPAPAGERLTLDFTVERPKGTVLYAWQTVIDGCDTGVILANGPPAPSVPTLAEWTLILFGLLLAGGAALIVQGRRRTA